MIRDRLEPQTHRDSNRITATAICAQFQEAEAAHVVAIDA
jgi:hypothetical protein